MSKIFISYRREDSAYVAAQLHEKLQKIFGKDSVFLDVDNIPIGVDFRKHINSAMENCDMLLVVIGDTWTGKEIEGKRNRLHETNDFVRLEIEAAIDRKIPIIPILIENAKMPGQVELPDSIIDFHYQNAAELRSGRDFNYHLEKLVARIEELLQQDNSNLADAKPFSFKSNFKLYTLFLLLALILSIIIFQSIL